MTTTQIFKLSVTVNNNTPTQDYIHLDDHTQPTYERVVYLSKKVYFNTHLQILSLIYSFEIKVV